MTHLESSRRSETTLWQRYSLSCPFGFGCSTLLFYRFKNQISEGSRRVICQRNMAAFDERAESS